MVIHLLACKHAASRELNESCMGEINNALILIFKFDVMTKQEFARKRNFAKFRLVGITTREIREVGTGLERTLIAEIDERLKLLRNGWDEGSKSLGLKVRTRCWCGKVISTSNYVDDRGELCCKEHKAD